MSSEQVPLVRPRRELRRKFRSVQQFLDIDSRFVSQPVEERHKIFRGEVAARPGTVRTTPKSRRGGVKLANTRLQTCESVGQTTAIRVVEMRRELTGQNLEILSYQRDSLGDLRSGCHRGSEGRQRTRRPASAAT